MTDTGMVHVAGLDVAVGPFLRQRCAWCGVILQDYDVRLMAVPEGQDPTVPTWPVGALILVDGGMKMVVTQAAGEDTDPLKLPDNACAALDPQVTR